MLKRNALTLTPRISLEDTTAKEQRVALPSFYFQPLGVASATPIYNRHLSAHIVGHNDRAFLLDCGDGTQFQLLRHRVRTRKLDAIFISHLHGDHIYGLPGLLTSMSLGGRKAKLELIGPVGIGAFVYGALRNSEAHLSYELDVQEHVVSDGPRLVFETEHLEVWAFPLQHRVPCLGYRFQEKPRRRRLLAQEAKDLNIPTAYFHLLKRENEVTLPDGRVIHPDQVLGDAPKAYSFAYCSDTAPYPALAAHIRAVDLLFHEATFISADEARARETHHSTAAQAARTALDAQVNRLLLGHFSARYLELDALLAEAIAVFSSTRLAVEGTVYPIDPTLGWDGD